MRVRPPKATIRCRSIRRSRRMVSCQPFRRSAARLLVLASLFATHGAVAQEAPPPDLTRTVEELQKRVEAQGRELSELRAALKDETRAREATRTPGVFRVGGLKVRMFGYVQADVAAYDQGSVDQLNPSTGEPLNETRFVLR